MPPVCAGPVAFYMPKRDFLVVYDFGQGEVWLRLSAESEEQIRRTYAQLDIVTDRPSWMTEEVAARLPRADIEDPDDPFLAALPTENDERG